LLGLLLELLTFWPSSSATTLGNIEILNNASPLFGYTLEDAKHHRAMRRLLVPDPINASKLHG
jgi:hypothetical protein